ncbi:MAG: FTR1 family protein [Burkholderiales bacterium]
MGQMLVATLREGLEAFLIVAIAAAYLRKTGRTALLPAVWWGTATAAALSLAIALWLAEYAIQPLWEGVLALVAAALVLSMVVYMQRAGKHLRSDISSKLESAARKTGAGAWIGVFLFVVLMITREGMEMAFITATLARATGISDTVIGAVLGALIAAALAWAWVRYGHRVNLGLFFQVTSIFLAIFACQLLLYGFHELTEAGVVPFIDNAHWHDATEDWAEGTIGGLITYTMVLAPLAWLLFATLRGRAAAPTAPPR